jgi:hypothetical protein
MTFQFKPAGSIVRLADRQLCKPSLEKGLRLPPEPAPGKRLNNTKPKEMAVQTVDRNDDGTGAQTTSYAYTWHSSSAQMESLTVTRPTLTSVQNGPGTADTDTTFYDSYGRAIWHKDGDGFLDYTEYDDATGAVLKTIVDVDTAQTSDFSNLPSGWSTPTGGGLHLTTARPSPPCGRHWSRAVSPPRPVPVRRNRLPEARRPG